MDILLTFFLLISALIVGVGIGFILGIKSYLKIAILVICIFIILDLYNTHTYTNTNANANTNTNANANANASNIIPNPNSQPNTVMASINNSNTTKYSMVEKPYNTSIKSADNPMPTPSSTFVIDKSPFDGLEPDELLKRLNYIYYATSNPQEPIYYSQYKTHADKLINSDENNTNANATTKLSTHDDKLLNYAKTYYPQLTEDQIDAKDCLNYGSEKNSCFQNPSLFFNVKNNFNILTKGVNEHNANLVIREDFSNPMILNPNARYEKPLFSNAQAGNLDKILDQQSNESINLDTPNTLCRHCKLAVCSNDYCNLQNQLFM